MKKSLLRKSLLSLAGMLVLCLSAGIVMTSCQKENVNPELPYLEFSKSYADDEALSEQDMEVLGMAVQRVKFIKSDGLFQMNVSSPDQINVSTGVFEGLKQIIERSNALVFDSQLIPRNRTKGPDEEASEPNSKRDCVAHSTGEATTRLGRGPSYNDANTYITNKYGNNGVPANHMLPLMGHFYGDKKVESINVNALNGIYTDNKSVVVVSYLTEPGIGHTVILYYSDKANGTHLGLDFQTNVKGDYVVIDSAKVINGIKVSK